MADGKPDFKTWFEREYAVPYPGLPFEDIHEVTRRLADAMARWCDERVR